MASHYANPLLKGSLVAAAPGVLRFLAPLGGTIEEILLFSDIAAAGNDAVFDVNINGTTVFADQSQRPRIIVGAVSGQRTGLSIAVNRGDKISLDLDVVDASGIGNNLYLVVTIDDGVGGGGGTPFTYFDIDGPPAAPSALDDEFGAPGLNAKWTPVNFAPTAAFSFDVDTTMPHNLFLRDNNSGVIEAILQALPAGDFTVVTKGHVLNGPNGNFRHWGLMLADGVTFGAGKQTVLSADIGQSTISIYDYVNHVFSANKGSIFGVDATLYTKMIYLRITRTAGVYKVSFSFDGYFEQGETILTPAGYTPTHIGLYMTTSARLLEVGVDFFRLYPSATARLGSKRTALS